MAQLYLTGGNDRDRSEIGNTLPVHASKSPPTSSASGRKRLFSVLMATGRAIQLHGTRNVAAHARCMSDEPFQRQSDTLQKLCSNSGVRVITTCADSSDETLAPLLRDDGMQVCVAVNAQELYQLIAIETFDLVILAGLPADENSPDVCCRLRGLTSMPIIVLTATGCEINGIRSLENGADDYLSKPFGDSESLARINAVIPRVRIAGPVNLAGHTAGFSFDNRILDSSTRSLQLVTGARTALPLGESKLLLTFCAHPNCAVSPAQLVDALHKTGDLCADGNLDVYIYPLRRQIEYSAQQPLLIETAPSSGYLFKPIVNPL